MWSNGTRAGEFPCAGGRQTVSALPITQSGLISSIRPVFNTEQPHSTQNQTSTLLTSRLCNFTPLKLGMNPSLAAVLIICTVFDATWCSFQLLLSLFTTKNDRVGPENSSTLPQFRIVLGIWSRSDAVQGTCRQDQRCRHPLDLKSPAPFRDIELATEHEKRTFGYESQEIVPEQQLRRDGSTRLRLLRNFAGVLLLSPTCMLVMSNYAVTTGLLDGCSHPELLPLGVSRCSVRSWLSADGF